MNIQNLMRLLTYIHLHLESIKMPKICNRHQFFTIQFNRLYFHILKTDPCTSCSWLNRYISFFQICIFMHKLGHVSMSWDKMSTHNL
ncbi:hypothetical protein EUGRSUZ_B01796 [Eucalyptus grandis]|uniref:Uncharacterized protein n=2 Tax=Eucalyptus grandis TaxID=71139 RepID=A0ACC3LRS7_EUCGR|nr:hypothetical protein EUGRSUZ_B01796 [Eucalyptus grandis]